LTVIGSKNVFISQMMMNQTFFVHYQPLKPKPEKMICAGQPTFMSDSAIDFCGIEIYVKYQYKE